MRVCIALIGNPNVGKSVVFNNLTGARQHTGNWPGKTVEKKEGRYHYKGHEFEIVDLPGVYSLSAMSEDERIARDYLVATRPDVVVDILNAAQLERNLYLTLQLIELQLNLVVVLNMYDIVEARGDKIDTERLSELLGAPVVVTTATKKKGMEELKEAILRAVPPHVLGESPANNEHAPGTENGVDYLHYHPLHHHHGQYERLRPPAIRYSPEIEKRVEEIIEILKDERELLERFPPRWIALRLLERDPDMLELVTDPDVRERILQVRVEP